MCIRDRFCIKGDNGSGKTTLLKLITGELTPTGGTIERADFTYICCIHLQVYEEIHCYLDNDLAGQKTEETIAGMYGKRVHNEALRYHEYKDLNDYLRGKKR